MTTQAVQIHMLQINTLVGDISGNMALIQAKIKEVGASSHQPSLLLFPELTLTGYPPEDLLLRVDFIARAAQAISDVQAITAYYPHLVVVVGVPLSKEHGLVNAALALQNGEVLAEHHKRELPNYRVFDEKRYFVQSQKPTAVFDWCGCRYALAICEDLWFDAVTDSAITQKAQVMLSLNSSPFHGSKSHSRHGVIEARSLEAKAAYQPMSFFYCNQVGGQDELVFDGGSFVYPVNEGVELIDPRLKMPSFISSHCVFERTKVGKITFMRSLESQLQCSSPMIFSSNEDQYLHHLFQALVLGTRDYVQKNGFKQVLLGLSGGIDSALTLALAVAALSADAVTAVMMPFTYTAAISIEDAKQQALTLGVDYRVRPIEAIYTAVTEILSEDFAGLSPGVAEENIQARCRGILLMALSNKHGGLVLTTGNKSELSVGYSTLYGDMAGGFNPIKDVPKVTVYALARFINQHSAVLGYDEIEVIPQRVIDRPASAELRADQTDQDSLPEYEVLDEILYQFIELDRSPFDIVAAGFDETVVFDVVQRVKLNEYKRRQAAPGIRISTRGFGRDRRFPITARW